MTMREESFMEYFRDTMLPNRNAITAGMVQHAAGLIGSSMNVSCPSCLHNSAVDLKNLYFRMLPAYEKWLKTKAEMNTTQTETTTKKKTKKTDISDDEILFG